MRKSDKTKGELGDAKHDEIAIWLYQNLKSEEFIREQLDIRPELKIKDIQVGLESPVHMRTDKFKTIRGYLDVILLFKFWDGVGKEVFQRDGKDVEYEPWQPIVYGFEVKTKVNVGETIRQLKTYRTYVTLSDSPISELFLVSLKTPHAEIFKEQGFSVIEYPCDSLS